MFSVKSAEGFAVATFDFQIVIVACQDAFGQKFMARWAPVFL